MCQLDYTQLGEEIRTVPTERLRLCWFVGEDAGRFYRVSKPLTSHPLEPPAPLQLCHHHLQAPVSYELHDIFKDSSVLRFSPYEGMEEMKIGSPTCYGCSTTAITTTTPAYSPPTLLRLVNCRLSRRMLQIAEELDRARQGNIRLVSRLLIDMSVEPCPSL